MSARRDDWARGRDVIDCHRRLAFGTAGERQVRINVLNDGKVALSYVVTQAWRVDGETCHSLMHLESPNALKGTRILIKEQRASSSTEIWLKLSTASRPVKIAHERTVDNVLGTDFSYEDLRFWYPLDAVEDFAVEDMLWEGDRAFCVSGTRLLHDGGMGHVEIVLAEDGHILKTASAIPTTDGQERELCCFDWHGADENFRFPLTRVAKRLSGRYSSTMHMEHLRLGSSVLRGDLEPDAMAYVDMSHIHDSYVRQNRL